MDYPKHSVNQDKNFISGYYIDKSFCNTIIEKVEQTQKRLLLNNDKTGFRNYLGIPLFKIDKELDHYYKTVLTDLLNLYMEEYPFIKNIQKLMIENLPETDFITAQVQKYKKGKFYNRLHCENGGSSTQYNNRAIVYMTYLNTIEEGGGTDFPSQNFQSKAEQGLTLLWPAYFTHPHMGIISEKSEKYIVTGYYEFDKKYEHILRS